ncbi:MAG: cobalamin biosynthesis protein, partial [Prevotellaceae bacterium]|nr:cobalamin biosynthesis protein [Prevotellaceae bacterium]
MSIIISNIVPLFFGWLLDRFFGDPACLPHPVVWFGKLISIGERKLNH